MTAHAVNFYVDGHLWETVIVEGVNDAHVLDQAREQTTAPDDAEAVVKPLPTMVAA
jgi:hypothetical protein